MSSAQVTDELGEANKLKVKRIFKDIGVFRVERYVS